MGVMTYVGWYYAMFHATVAAVGEAIAQALDGLEGLDGDQIKERRREKYLAIGHRGVA